MSMAVTTSMWTHGHSMEIEYPDRLESIRRAAYYIEVHGKPETTNWFHFAIPTPVILSGEALRIGSVFIRFKTDDTDARIKEVHLYDGENRIAAFDQLDLQSKDFATFRFDPELLSVDYGLGVSIYVNFGSEGETPEMKFSSAGCDFFRDSNSSIPATKSKSTRSRGNKRAKSKKRR